MEPIEQPMQEPRDRCEKATELKLLRALIDRYDESPPSRVDVEEGLKNGLARLMLLEGRLREHAPRERETQPSEERCGDHDLVEEIRALLFVEEIRALREAVAGLRACASRGGMSPRIRLAPQTSNLD